VVRGIEYTREHGIGDRIGEELPTHVAAIENALVDGITFGGGKLGVGLNVAGWHPVLFRRHLLEP
jgi:hypothetical protein